MSEFININKDNLATEHLCCAIADKKHQCGVDAKRAWLADRLPEGHVFRKLNERGKVFIEYAPLERAWAPVLGENYIYLYCLWVSGSFKGKGYGGELLESCIADAKRQGKSGICALSSPKKKPFLSDGKFLRKYGFQAVDTSGGEYELLSLSFDGTQPRFAPSAKAGQIESETLTIFYSPQCPYIPDCIAQVEAYCGQNAVPLRLAWVDTAEKAKAVPCVFNNWAVFYGGKFQTVQLLNANYLKKLLNLQ
ncbi:MAG: GNAT family N-acetyltransferase [Christensenellaceae bacterium]|jgi:GNAT superfamily N-acetyltransferase|nr:GNAT family N-acetyltransferase [Christensenellaceae bacterium]